MPRLLLTGGAGFIGSQLARSLTEAGWEVRVLDRLTYAGRREHLDGVDCELVVGDVCDAEAVARAVDGCAAVVHAAAESHVERSLSDPGSFLRTNVDGTRVLLAACAQAEVDQVLVFSTDEVFGPARDDQRFGPEERLRPGNPYAASKAAAEALVHAWRNSYDLQASIVRCVNCYGPRQHPEKAVPWWARDALQGFSVPVQGVGSAQRDWLYVEDLARGIVLALEHGEPGATWHFAAHSQLPNLAMARRVLAEVARRTGRLAQVEFIAERQGQDRRYALDDSETRARLGWLPQVPVEEGLERTVSWIAEEGLALWS